MGAYCVGQLIKLRTVMNKAMFFGQIINAITRGDETCLRFKHDFHYLFDLHFPVLFVSQQCKQKPWERADAPLSGTFVEEQLCCVHRDARGYGSVALSGVTRLKMKTVARKIRKG